jgi:hypothetical protein
MAMLLYNFLLSDFYRLEAFFNPINQRHEHEVRFIPVLRNFGIERQTGYVTAVENYATTLEVYAPDGSKATLTGVPIDERLSTGANRFTAVGYDVEIRWPVWTSGSAAVGNWVWDPVQNAIVWGGTPAVTGSWDMGNNSTGIRTTKAELKLDLDVYGGYEGDLLLLGKKIIVFRHLAGRRAQVELPTAMVIGKKTPAASMDNAATFNSGRDTLETITLVTDDATISHNHRHGQTAWGLRLAGAAVPANIYTLDQWGIVAPTSSGELFTLAQRISQQTALVKNYNLVYVDNGYAANGLKEFYYIYTPVVIAFRAADDNDGLNLRDAYDNKYARPNVHAHSATTLLTGWKAQKGSLAVGTAYMVSISGRYRADIEVYQTLVESVKDTRIIALSAGRIVFENIAAAVTFTNPWKEKAGGWGNENIPRLLSERASVFSDADGANYFARKTGDATPAGTYTRYGVVIADPTNGASSGHFIGGNPILRYSVFDIANNRVVQMFLAGPDIGGILDGAYIAFRTNIDYTWSNDTVLLAAPGTVLSAAAGTSQNFRQSATHTSLQSAGSVFALGAGLGRYGAMAAQVDFAFNTPTSLQSTGASNHIGLILDSGTGLLNIGTVTPTSASAIIGASATAGQWNWNIGSGTNVEVGTSAFVTSSTQFVLVSGDATRAARFTSLAALQAALGENGLGSARAVAFVATGSRGFGTGVAQVVFVSSDKPFDIEPFKAPLLFGTITNTVIPVAGNTWLNANPAANFHAGYYYVGSAYVYGHGNVPVATQNADLLIRGNLVRLDGLVGISDYFLAVDSGMATATLNATTLLNDRPSGAASAYSNADYWTNRISARTRDGTVPAPIDSHIVTAINPTHAAFTLVGTITHFANDNSYFILNVVNSTGTANVNYIIPLARIGDARIHLIEYNSTATTPNAEIKGVSAYGFAQWYASTLVTPAANTVRAVVTVEGISTTANPGIPAVVANDMTGITHSISILQQVR